MMSASNIRQIRNDYERDFLIVGDFGMFFRFNSCTERTANLRNGTKWSMLKALP